VLDAGFGYELVSDHKAAACESFVDEPAHHGCRRCGDLR
jgi:hypothetical protein